MWCGINIYKCSQICRVRSAQKRSAVLTIISTGVQILDFSNMNQIWIASNIKYRSTNVFSTVIFHLTHNYANKNTLMNYKCKIYCFLEHTADAALWYCKCNNKISLYKASYNKYYRPYWKNISYFTWSGLCNVLPIDPAQGYGCERHSSKFWSPITSVQ